MPLGALLLRRPPAPSKRSIEQNDWLQCHVTESFSISNLIGQTETFFMTALSCTLSDLSNCHITLHLKRPELHTFKFLNLNNCTLTFEMQESESLPEVSLPTLTIHASNMHRVTVIIKDLFVQQCRLHSSLHCTFESSTNTVAAVILENCQHMTFLGNFSKVTDFTQPLYDTNYKLIK